MLRIPLLLEIARACVKVLSLETWVSLNVPGYECKLEYCYYDPEEHEYWVLL